MNEREIYAHTLDDGEWEPLDLHLSATAHTARDAAIPEFEDIAYLAGLLHDVGKASDGFQAYLRGNGVRVEHSASGAKYIDFAQKSSGLDDYTASALEYAIAGHHSGLPDYGTRTDNEDMPTLCARLKRASSKCNAYAEKLFESAPPSKAYMEFLKRTIEGCDGQEAREKYRERYIFSVRYLYSLLTDADYLETEAFCRGRRDPLRCDFAAAERKLTERLARFKADTPVRAARARLQQQACNSVAQEARLYTLDMPTGSGKTLAGLRLALRLLRERKLKRIIYIIPYTSILDQTAAEFLNYFTEDELLVCHCNYDYEQNTSGDGDKRAADKLRKAAENWDAPIVLSTNVQFFESIYSNRSSKLRKLHNMADSVLVFDEIHLMPIKYFQPCLSAVEQLTRDYGCTAIFMSATMPDFSALSGEYARKMNFTPLITDRVDFSAFYNSDFEYLGECGDERLAERAACNDSSLIIVNSRSRAKELYSAVAGNKVHLSTAMTPVDRAAAIAGIRSALNNGDKITVISTSLIEAGVDLDFEFVFRELSGLDNILQAAGRCNREGKRDRGTTYIFESSGETANRDAELEAKRSIARCLIEKYGASGLRDPECIQEYYNEVYAFSDRYGRVHGHKINAPRFIGCKPFQYAFAAYADNFKMIEDASFGVVVPNEEISDEIAAIENGRPVDRRKLRLHTASVTYKTARELIEMGAVRRIDGYLILDMPEFYSKELGLVSDVFEPKIV